MKKAIGIIMMVLLLSVTAGCTVETKAEVKELSIGSMPTQSAAIYAVGVERGIFEDNGVKVNLAIFKSGQERDSAAVAGELDGFMTDMMGLINLVEKDYQFKITSYEYENFGVMANGQSGINSTDAVNGQAIGMAENTVVEYIADTLLNSSDFNKIQVPRIPDRLATVLGGEVEMGVFPEPFISIIKAKGGAEVISSADQDIQPVVLVFSEEAVLERDEVVNFYKGYNATVDYMKNNSYDAYKEVLVDYGLVKEELVDQIKIPVDLFEHATMPTERDFDDVVKWMDEKEMIDKEYRLKDVAESSFVN